MTFEKREIQLLGNFIVKDDGQLSPLLSHAKGCALLAYLIVINEPVSRPYLADLLWEATSSKQALGNLRKTLYQIRPIVPSLHVSRQHVAYQPDVNTTIDLRIVEDAIRSEKIEAIKPAIKLYQGDFLEDFYLDSSPRFMQWVRHQQVTWQSRIQKAFERIFFDATQQQDWSTASTIAQAYFNLMPFNETALRHLMQSLALDGNMKEAQAVFETFSNRLMNEDNNRQPDPETIALYDQILTNTVAPFLLSEPDTRHFIVPYHRNKTFTGRQSELKYIADYFFQPSNTKTKALVITGLGGIGKSQLMIEYAYQNATSYNGGIYWISFANPDSIMIEIAHLGSEQGMQLYKSDSDLNIQEKVNQVQRAWQSEKLTLLLFDNCDVQDLLLRWLPMTGKIHTLITSRYTNWSPELPLQSYRLPVLQRAESIDLLRKFAPSIEQDRVLADTLAQKLGDLPLALQLAGYYLANHSDSDISTYLQVLEEHNILHHPSMKGDFTPYSPTGHELNIVKTFNYTYQRLQQDDTVNDLTITLLHNLAHFAAGVSVPLGLLFTTIRDDFDDVMLQTSIQQLSAWGLITILSNQNVVIHRLLVAYVRDIIPSSKTIYLDVCRAIIETLKAHREKNLSLKQLPFEYDHLVFAQRIIRDIDDSNLLSAELFYLMGAYQKDNANFDEAKHNLELALALLDSAKVDTDEKRATIFAEYGALLYILNDYELATDYYHQAYEIRYQLFGEQHPATLRSLNQIAISHHAKGDYAQSKALFEKILAIQRDIFGADHIEITQSLNNLGAVCKNMALFEASANYFERALTIRRAVLGENHLLTARSYSNYGDLISKEFDVKRGIPYLEHAFAIYQAQLTEGHPTRLTCTINLAEALRRNDELERSLQLIQKVEQDAIETLGENHILTARLFNTLGVIYTNMKSFERAKYYLNRALAVRLALLGETHIDTQYSYDCLEKLAEASSGTS